MIIWLSILSVLLVGLGVAGFFAYRKFKSIVILNKALIENISILNMLHKKELGLNTEEGELN